MRVSSSRVCAHPDEEEQLALLGRQLTIYSRCWTQKKDTSLFFQFATVLAQGQAPIAVVEGIRMGRIIVLVQRSCPSMEWGRSRMERLARVPEGDRGDMPMLFCLGMHPSLMAAQERLRFGERIFAFLDDVCIVCLLGRVETVVSILAAELWAHAQIQVHKGKTQVWNRAGKKPVGMHDFTIRARCIDLDAIVWRGDARLNPSQRGIKVLGSPIGSDEFVRTQLHATVTEHSGW